MRFGFDIDDTLIDLRGHAFDLYNKKLNKSVGKDVFHALKTIEIHEAFGLDSKQGSEMWQSLSEEIYYTDCPAFEGAVEALQKLQQDGHDIFYITARKAEHAVRTREWMKKNGFPVKDSHFYCGMKDEEKIEIIRNLKLDYYFDDKPAVLSTLGGLTTAIIAIDNGYNQMIDLPRLRRWSELKTLVTENQKQNTP
ncbi:5' nucleotidase, NT5C type [Bacillus massiliglaciei]|uniref:5' nucleotidase, NT5C type n=1 Tax=Bacillus massiliglaciei TaxID=1816693 RepID=UPI000A473901|nr:HAD family acid phosphatase [Bacillus massiliglaciei]